ncbi:SUMF1/EgtB/PvdO family nonheme iron enzyme [Desulfococcus sp.]|uniref:SUMF1/EgtB/PvdO family nonheme iron enzyme n=1 Tax=Desulfococcus sp. TaxID=2025834 RepID=UPI003593F893
MSLLLASAMGTLSALAEAPPPTVCNPKPAEGDLILPMPGDAEMVFRRVRVPGSGFWGDQSRIIQIGDAGGGIFEGLQRTQISGSFPVEKEDAWEVMVAKYELTRGQYVAVMGMDALMAASGDPEDQKLPTLEGRVLRDAFMRPLTFVSHQEVLEFIRRYNQWLFDPAHPERLTAMPRVDGAPGFLRLPAEDEWEYCARGGTSAVQAGTFNDRIPFSAEEINEYAWHLGNAKHQIRPVGLRKADAHGIHDIIGNAQEMTSGLFRPEIWQGKPGGVAVRGGSVSTPPGDLRSSLRAELDVYAWNADEKKVEERRSFNSGARLAIGANVVVNTAQRARIEKEYEDYKALLRRSMPVGRTLDNLVAQASVQLGSVDPILDRLMKENETLREPLKAVQATLDKAREQLDLAQRENARSLAQDATRNGVNLSAYLSRLERLAETLKTAKDLAAVSTRYQEQLAAVEKSVHELEIALNEQLQGYTDKIGTLGEYEQTYIEHAFQQLEGKEMTRRERLVLELVKLHAASFAEKRRTDGETWLTEYRQKFTGFSDL